MGLHFTTHLGVCTYIAHLLIIAGIARLSVNCVNFICNNIGTLKDIIVTPTIVSEGVPSLVAPLKKRGADK